MQSIISVILSFMALGMLFSGCKDDDPPFMYETTAMVLGNANSSSGVPVIDNDSVPKGTYALQLNLTMNLTSYEGADSYESSYYNEDQVTSFSITSPNTFNNILPGESLNQFFNFYSSWGGETAIISSNFTNIFSGRPPGHDFHSTWNTPNFLLLVNPPTNTGIYTFDINAGFSDGRTLSGTVSVKLY